MIFWRDPLYEDDPSVAVGAAVVAQDMKRATAAADKTSNRVNFMLHDTVIDRTFQWSRDDIGLARAA